MQKILVIVLAVLAVIAVASLLVGRYFVSGMDLLSACTENVVSEVVAPNKGHVATVLIRNCGTTAGYVTHVNVRKMGSRLTPNANGVIDVGNVWNAEGQLALKIYWKDDSVLEVTSRDESGRSTSKLIQLNELK